MEIRSRQAFDDHSVQRVVCVGHGTVQHHLHSVIHSLRYQVDRSIQTQLQRDGIVCVVLQAGLHRGTGLVRIESDRFIVDDDLRNHVGGPV